MDSKKLVDELRKKYDAPNNKKLSEMLGVSYALINKWHSEPKELTVKQVANLLDKSKEQAKWEAHQFSIRPIVEYYPIEAHESLHGASFELFNSEYSGNKRQEGIKSYLKESCGVYIFYDSRGEALYVGKAKEQNLWDEMKSAFNRDRQTQKIRTVNHPVTGTGFKPAYESPRKIELLHMQLADLATYFSAYEVDIDMINNVEALLVRVYANGLLNARMEKFAEHV